jgi:hypothetical protein
MLLVGYLILLSNSWLCDGLIRNHIGQISRYMFHAKVRYGFLSTYKGTIFLKQEQDISTYRQSWVLWYSNIISHETSSSDVAPGISNPLEYHDKVSVRECFLFFAQEIQKGDHKATNTMNAREWVGMRSKALRIENFHIDEPSSSDNDNHSDGSQRVDESYREESSDLSEPLSNISDPFSESDEKGEDTRRGSLRRSSRIKRRIL